MKSTSMGPRIDRRKQPFHAASELGGMPRSNVIIHLGRVYTCKRFLLVERKTAHQTT
jgi:hypothetical protein